VNCLFLRIRVYGRAKGSAGYKRHGKLHATRETVGGPQAGAVAVAAARELVADPEVATHNDVAAERIRVAEAYLACKRRQADLAASERQYRLR
jgi:hypothetical protein